MAAPLGFKTFNTGDVLSAADTNGYLMQGVLVFADATARSAAITSPQEGQTSYLKDTDVIQVYSGSAWVTKSGGSSPLTTKGDLYTYSTTDARLPVGTNGHTLVANSATATGLEWQAPASGGMTLLNSPSGTTFTGSTLTISITPTGYKSLKIYLKGVYATADATMQLRFNGDTGSNYSYVTVRSGPSQVTSASTTSIFYLTQGSATSGSDVKVLSYVELDVFDPNATDVVQVHHSSMNGPSGDMRFTFGVGAYDCSAAITSISFIANSGNFSGGTAYVYGVK
jgi:hypothetical protein